MATKKSQPSKKTEEGLFWASPVYIPKIGTVKGRVNPEHLAKFKELTAKVEGFDIQNYLTGAEPAPKVRKAIE